MIDKDKYLLYKLCRLKLEEKASEAVLLSENKKQIVPQYNLLFIEGKLRPTAKEKSKNQNPKIKTQSAEKE